MKFKPTQYDLDWTKGLLRRMNEGGIWAYRSGPIAVQVFPSKLEFRLSKTILYSSCLLVFLIWTSLI